MNLPQQQQQKTLSRFDKKAQQISSQVQQQQQIDVPQLQQVQSVQQPINQPLQQFQNPLQQFQTSQQQQQQQLQPLGTQQMANQSLNPLEEKFKEQTENAHAPIVEQQVLKKTVQTSSQSKLQDINPMRQLELRRQFQMSIEQVDPMTLSNSHIYLVMSGLIENGECRNDQNLQIRYDLVSGKDWTQISGQRSGLSQQGSANTNTDISENTDRDVVWNFPFEAVFKTTNPMGWPQILVSVYGLDIFGRSELKGYGSVHIPTQPGAHQRTIYLYKPKATSMFLSIFGFLAHQAPEYRKPDKTISSGEGREVTRVSSSGHIRLKFQCLLRNMKQFGYSI